MNENIQDFGPYTVEAEIGRGGMGVVYRATDTRLGRPVAIKALPEDLADDAERLARFEREARTLAALNHPNVAGIHGVEEHDGRRYLVLEYVDGETLAERLDRGPLAVDEALEVCTQISRGVEAAHEAGIIHRDLKPGNVKLTPDGKVKVLDFGLAMWTLDLETLKAQQWFDRPLTSSLVSMSVDGKWVAYTKLVQDRLEVFIRSFPDGEMVRRVSIDGGFAPRWSDGGEIFFAEGSSLMVSRVRERADGTVEVDQPEQIGLLPPTLPGTFPFDVTPDGTRFLVIRAKYAAGGSLLRLVENWGAGGS